MEEKEQINKELEKTEKPQKPYKWLIILIISIVSVIFFSFIILAGLTVGYKKIYNGVSINNVDVGGMTLAEAKNVLNNYYRNVRDLDVDIVCDEEEETISGRDINVYFDSDKAVGVAYKTGRDGKNIIEKITKGIKCQIKKENILVDVSYDRLKFDSKIDKLVNRIGKPIIEASYVRAEDKLFVTTGVTGIEVDQAYIKEEAIKQFNNCDTSRTIICNSKKVAPKPVDMVKIRNEIKQEVQDAKYINNSGAFEVTPQVVGIDFNLEEATQIAKSIDEEGVQFSIELIITEPQSTTNEILKGLFKDELSSFTTYYNVNEKQRTENVKLSAQLVNDTILMPGKEFSYNTTVGERSTERGFQTAKVYQAGQIIDGLGGGICQTSSTLYNAVLLADLEVTERKNHSLSVAYVDLGRDATVSYGTIDFKFKNNRKTPIKLEANTNGGSLTIKIMGIKGEDENTVSIRTETISVIPFTEKIIEDSNLPVGQVKLIQTGKRGYKVKAYKVKKKNGVVVEEKLLSTDTYAPVVQIKRIGVEPTLEGL